MRIAVMAAGGVGGYFGAKLAQAGHEVAFVARGRHLAAIRERGLVVKSAAGDIHVANAVASDDPESLGAFDVVLFAVKLWDTEIAAAAMRPLLAGGGVVIPFQNGVESIERVGSIVGAAQVMGGAAYIAATIAEPGVILHTGQMARLRFGPVLREQGDVAQAFRAACTSAGIDAELAVRVHREYGDSSPVVVGDEHVFAGRMNTQVRGARPFGTDRIQQGQPAGCAVNRVRADRAGSCALVIGNFIRGIQMRP